MKKQLFISSVTVLLICSCASLWINAKRHKQLVNDLILENVEALTALEYLDGIWVIVDEIPCSSSASEIEVTDSYVNCTTCTKEKGHAPNENGKCTVVRPVIFP